MERTQVDIINDNLIIGSKVTGAIQAQPAFRRIGNFVINMNDIKRIVYFDGKDPMMHLIYQHGSTDTFEMGEEYEQLKRFFDSVKPL